MAIRSVPGGIPLGGAVWGDPPWGGTGGTIAPPLLQVYQGVTEELLRALRDDPDLLLRITPEVFERLVANRFEQMGFSVQLTGNTNTKDGGIDFVATPQSTGEFKFLIAGQVKHHGSRDRKTRVNAVDRLLAWKSKEARFHLGCLVTNTDFTRDARAAADQDAGQFVRLRNGEDVTRWLNDDFIPDLKEVPTEIALAPGVRLQLPPSFFGTSVEVWPTPREE